MRCPACGARLDRLDRHGVATDRCPGCRGVWLAHEDLAALVEWLLLAPIVREPRHGRPGCRACVEREVEASRARQALLRDLFAADLGPATDRHDEAAPAGEARLGRGWLRREGA